MMCGAFLTYFNASGGSLVPETLMVLRDTALLKNCLNAGGISFPFLFTHMFHNHTEFIGINKSTKIPECSPVSEDALRHVENRKMLQRSFQESRAKLQHTHTLHYKNI